VELETAILNQDPALDLAPRAGSHPTGEVPVVPLPTSAAPPPPGHDILAGISLAPGARLVGRDAELRQVLAALDEARGAPRVVLVEGEPGIGKTRLVEELAAVATARGMAVLWGRAFEGGAAPAFWPWLPPLRALVAQPPAGLDIGPELRALASSTGANGTAGPTSDRSRYQLFDAVTALVRGSAAERPVLVVLDDIQWADLASLELLAYLSGQLVDSPVLLACTVRQLEVGRNDAVVEALASLSRVPATRRILLRGLSLRATTELVASATGRAVEPEVTEAIQQRAEGNPFFATELAQLLDAERAEDDSLVAVGAGGDVPSGVRDVVRRRIALLPETTVPVLQVAAVIGRDVDVDLLTTAAGKGLDGVLEAIEPAVVHRLMAPLPDRPTTFRFSHALVREVVADDVSALRRARIHLAVADALDERSGGLDDAAEILAEHLWAAAPLGVGQRAAEALEHAAEVAVRRYAFESAEGLLARAAQLRRTAGSTASDIEAELVTSCRLLSIQRSVHGYASVAQSPHLRRAKELARRSERVDILARLLWTEWAAYDSMCDFDRSDAVALQLHELGSGSSDPLVRVTGLASLGISRWHRGEVGEASTLLDEAVVVGSGVPVPAMTLVLDLEVLLLPYPFSRYLQVLTGALEGPAEAEIAFEELAAAAPDRYAVSLVQMFSAGAALTTGRFEWAERAARKGIEADPESTFSFWGRGLQGYLAAALIEQGRYDEGLAALDSAIDRFVEAGGRTGVVVYNAARAAGLAGAGRLDAAARAVTSAYRELETYGERFAEPLVLEADARYRHAAGEPGAEDLLARATELATASGAHAVARRIQATAERLLTP
jgi:tetratricopeptide (TPR) repeat protein